ncbi:tetratricopeptide repeat protein [Gemmatimonadota bacterium]
MPDPSLLQRLKERKLVQWALAYLAGAWVLFEVSDAVGGRLGWPDTLYHGLLVLLAIGFFVALVIAWYHGEKGRQRVSGPELLMVAALLVVAGVALSTLGGAEGTKPRSVSKADADRTSIAVLPLDNLSPEAKDAYFAGGLHGELPSELAKVRALKVISRTSVMEYATRTQSLREIADQLDVGTIVEGSVQVLGDRLRVNVQLIDAATDEHLWADRYDRTLDDAFAVQSEIARQVVAAVGAELTAAEASAITAPPTQDAEAYRIYLQGEEYRRRDPYLRQDFEIAQLLFERALALDSMFALAYVSLADVHGWMYWLGYDPIPGRLERQRTAAEAAVQLAPDLPRARAAMGMVLYNEHDYARALQELTVAVEGLPGSAELWELVGLAQRRLGNWDQALAAFEKAAALDPRVAGLRADSFGGTLQFLHRYREAVEAYNQALELLPDYWSAALSKAWAHLRWRGELDSVRSVLQRGTELDGPGGNTLSWRARLALLERNPDALLILLGAPQVVTLESQRSYEPGLLYAAWAHQLRGESNEATRAFTGALAQLDSALVELPDDWRMRASRGLALAGLGRRTEARAEAEWLRKTVPPGFDRADKVEYEAVALIFTQVGPTGEALREIELLLEGPSMTSVHTLRLDPRFDAIRDDPRFQALLERYAPDVEH